MKSITREQFLQLPFGVLYLVNSNVGGAFVRTKCPPIDPPFYEGDGPRPEFSYRQIAFASHFKPGAPDRHWRDDMHRNDDGMTTIFYMLEESEVATMVEELCAAAAIYKQIPTGDL
jgi:hypothetical protein